MTDLDPPQLGDAIRARRKALGMTIVQLAERAALSHPFVSQLERGRANPSFDSLGRLAHALGTSQIELLSGTALDSASAGLGAFGAGSARMLTHGDTRFSVIESAGANTDLGDFYEHPEDEFITVIAGSVVLELGADRLLIDEGDSRYFAGGTPHRWGSPDGSPYRLLVVKERRREADAPAGSDEEGAAG
ncbi:helix-turn-helix domain-containing protein [Microbacterium sp. G2-8]|uniref:helix-turn-helix domain-containing protein n=1 Tax=Microbacterium sp. G2-8 TaxID=2842454 RepID=UPI001C88E85E|nr:XRE family transcriptional regulator [Microbacterium sp. G2-8]